MPTAKKFSTRSTERGRQPQILPLRINGLGADNAAIKATVVACENLSGEVIEFLRWKAKRWMRLRHLSALVSHDPLFVLLNVWRILSFNFRGTSWRSLLGLEKENAVFERYRVIRQAERSYL
jgi:hypothetical protein